MGTLQHRRLRVLWVALLWACLSGRARADTGLELESGAVASAAPAKVGLELGARLAWPLSSNADLDVAAAARGMLAESVTDSSQFTERNVHGMGLRAMVGIRYWGRASHQGLYVRFAVGGEHQWVRSQLVDSSYQGPLQPPLPPMPRTRTSLGLVFEPSVGYRLTRGRWQLGVEVSVCLPVEHEPYPQHGIDEWSQSKELHLSLVVAHRL